MSLPRDLSGVELAKLLGKVGYSVSRQSGSHIRLTTTHPTQHHITVPAHDPLKVGTLAAILGEVAAHLKTEREQLVRQLFS